MMGMARVQMRDSADEQVRADLVARNTVFLQRLSVESPKTAVGLGPVFWKRIGLKPPAPARKEPEIQKPEPVAVADPMPLLPVRPKVIRHRITGYLVRNPWGWTMTQGFANARQVMDEVAERRGLSVADLKGRSRHRPVVLARQEAMYLMRHHFAHYSLPLIGSFFDRDHTTVLHGCRAHAARYGLPPVVSVEPERRDA